MSPKPIDRWLGMAGIVAGLVTFVAPRTTTFIICLLVLCFLLLIHPVWNFWWIERSFVRRLASLFVVSLTLAFVGLASLPKESSPMPPTTIARMRCYPYDPRTNAYDTSLPPRPCLAPPRLIYIKWWDKTKYAGTDPETGRWPNDRPNRVLSFAYRDSGGNNRWTERNLFRLDGDKAIWQDAPTQGGWLEVVGNTSAIVKGEVGVFLRREDSRCDAATGKKRFYDVFVPLDVQDRLKRGEHPEMCFRQVLLDCDITQPLGMDIPPTLDPLDAPFSICNRPIVTVATDRPLQ